MMLRLRSEYHMIFGHQSKYLLLAQGHLNRSSSNQKRYSCKQVILYSLRVSRSFIGGHLTKCRRPSTQLSTAQTDGFAQPALLTSTTVYLFNKSISYTYNYEQNRFEDHRKTLCSREVNKNNLLGGQFLILLPQTPGK